MKLAAKFSPNALLRQLAQLVRVVERTAIARVLDDLERAREREALGTPPHGMREQ